MAELIGFGQLPSGSKILWESVAESRTVSLGFFFRTGSRLDPPGKKGTGHFVEHMLFKGTRSYSAAALARAVDRVGGDLNAYTEREEMAFLCSVPAEHWHLALEVLFEICFQPTFPSDEFSREREVIQSEILASLEDPEELSYDTFLQNLAPVGPYALPIAGTEKSLSSITPDDVREWWNQNIRPENLTVGWAGLAVPREIETVLSEKFSELGPEAGKRSTAGDVFRPSLFRKEVRAPFQMAQVLGGFSLPKSTNLEAFLVQQSFSLLWGENMSSRLFQNVREKLGLCYSISCQIFETEETSSLHFFSSCAPSNAEKLLAALKKEVSSISTSPPSLEEWEDARSALRGGLLLGSERMENRVQRLVHHYWEHGILEPLETILNHVAQTRFREPFEALKEHLVLENCSLLLWGKWKSPRPGILSSLWEN